LHLDKRWWNKLLTPQELLSDDPYLGWFNGLVDHVVGQELRDRSNVVLLPWKGKGFCGD
jgi:hypothetical protein